MKSICIKTNNKQILDYLLNELEYVEEKPIIVSTNQFKYYKNIILHYKGKNYDKFVHEISCILSCLVIDELEESFLKRIIVKNYFYFNKEERKKILEICFDLFTEDFNDRFDKKYNLLVSNFYEYLLNNKSIVLDGFINFRIKNYLDVLEDTVDEATNTFVIEKEYYEFISLLKMYINSQPPKCDVIHLVYNNQNSILLDEDKNIIDTKSIIFRAKYLSDISFSSNDYALNGLLTIIPKKIYVHLIDNYSDEFINTIKLIFDGRVEFCNGCDICKLYKYI